MLSSIKETINKTCVIGLSYFDSKNNLIKQSMLGGKVISADTENGITLKLATDSNDNNSANFIIPAELSCWFIAPKGDFHTSDKNIKITNPDYLITWDIFQTKADKSDGEQQWWQWRPRTVPPKLT